MPDLQAQSSVFNSPIDFEKLMPQASFFENLSCFAASLWQKCTALAVPATPKQARTQVV